MALPSLAKIWLFSTNNTIATGGTFVGYGLLHYTIKQALTTLGSNPWTVVSSSDGVGNFGASDLWVTASGIEANVHANPGANHSWIVLQQTALGGGTLQMCWDMVLNTGGQSTITNSWISEGGLFTAGSATNRPTATDEVITSIAVNDHQWCSGLDLTVNPAQLHIQISSDGECSRWWVYINGVIQSFIAVEKPKGPVPGWTPPWLCVAPVDRYASTSYVPSYQYLNDANSQTSCRMNSVKNNLYLTSEGLITSMLGEQMTFGNDLDSNAYPILPIGLYSDTAGARGRHGTLFDMWWGSTLPSDGDHYPGDASRQFVQVRDLILPWPGGSAPAMLIT